MLKQFRRTFVQNLWNEYRTNSQQIKMIEKGLKQKGVEKLFLDHFAIIDLPGNESGIHQLKPIFASLGFREQGSDYLPSKQNDFLWMTETDCDQELATNVLPQVVVADFRLDELPIEVRKVVFKYASLAPKSPVAQVQSLSEQVAKGDIPATQLLNQLLVHYFAGRDWPLPTVREFNIVHEFNELIAWVLVFGRRPNHFTLSIHLLEQFSSLNNFHHFIENELQLSLNRDGGIIKGGAVVGIAQGSTKGDQEKIMLADGFTTIPTGFVEFVWRYSSKQTPTRWQDFFTGFVANHANNVIESLYINT